MYIHIYTKIKNKTQSPAHTHTYTHTYIHKHTYIHPNPRSCTQTHTHAHTNCTHTCIALCKPLRPSLLSRSKSHVCAHTRYRYAYPCPYQSLSHIHIQTWRPHTHRSYHTTPHMLPHTPMAPYTLPPSLPHSHKRRELVKDARRQHADRVAVEVEIPGHETRRQSALTHSTSTCPLCPSACTCTCPMHMPHAHARVHRGSLALHIRAPCILVRMCMRL
jgi:hypothetical protein